jgi:hypothetical protein
MRSFGLVLPLLLSLAAHAEPPKVGDQAKNLKVLPPWTMKLCPTELQATYDANGALELKKKDNDCALWRDAAPLLQQQVADYKKLTEKNNQLVESYKKVQELDQVRIANLITQLKKEIEEKNTYKYKPTYSWLWGIIGGSVALVATGVAIGVGVAYAKK